MMDVYVLPGKAYGKRRAVRLLWQPGCSQNSCILKSLYSCQFLAVPGFLMFTSFLKVKWYLIFVLICISLIRSEPKHLIKCCNILIFFFLFIAYSYSLSIFCLGLLFFTPIDLYGFWIGASVCLCVQNIFVKFLDVSEIIFFHCVNCLLTL